MSKIACIVFFVLLVVVVPCISNAETIDVQIKGVDDGAKTTKQRDYKEAILFAKREAIERAGVKIKSMTTVKDLVVNSDYIESKAEAVLLPGYNILDMGYSADGTYQVVLIGKVKPVSKKSEDIASKEEWTPAIVRGQFVRIQRPQIDSWSYYWKGNGNSHFSFKSGTSKSNGGDIWLEVSAHRYVNKNKEFRFRLNGDWFIDLGNTLPEMIEIPDQFATPKWQAREPDRMIKGNYYILSRGRLRRSVLIRITEIDISNFRWFSWKGDVSVDFAVAFEYRNVSNSLDELLRQIKNPSNN